MTTTEKQVSVLKASLIAAPVHLLRIPQDDEGHPLQYKLTKQGAFDEAALNYLLSRAQEAVG